jgi:hypothetical protein
MDHGYWTKVRKLIRIRHYSIRAERAYVQWIRRFILFHGKRHPRDMGSEELTAFLGHLASERIVAASTQNQSLNLRSHLARAGSTRRIRMRLPPLRTREQAPVVRETNTCFPASGLQ